MRKNYRVFTITIYLGSLLPLFCGKNYSLLQAQESAEAIGRQEIRVSLLTGVSSLDVESVNDSLADLEYLPIPSFLWKSPMIGMEFDYLIPGRQISISLSYALRQGGNIEGNRRTEISSHLSSIDIGYDVYNSDWLNTRIHGGVSFGATHISLGSGNDLPVSFDSALHRQNAVALDMQNQSIHLGVGVNIFIPYGRQTKPSIARSILLGLRLGGTVLDASQWSADGTRFRTLLPPGAIPRWYVNLAVGYRMSFTD